MAASESSDRFQTPQVVLILERPLSFLRSQYSVNFSDLMSKEIDTQDDYKNGLVGLACFLGGILMIWGLMLVFFMIKGKTVGCASGRAFETRQVDHKKKHKKYDNTRPISVTDSEEDDTHSHHDEEDHKENDGAFVSEHEHGQRSDEHDEHYVEDIEEDASFQSSLCSSDVISRYDSDTQSHYQNTRTEERSIIDTSPRVEGPRAMRTRIVFFVFALSVLACIPLALAFAFAPMKETVKSFDGNFDEADDFIASARAAANTVSTASQSAMGILSQTSTNFSSYCPNVNQTIESDTTVLGVDLLGLSNLISHEYVVLQMEVTDNLTKIENMLQAVEETVEILETSFHRTENVIWLVPGLLLGVSILTALATFGVILAWKQDSGLRLQRFMSYAVLPALVAVCILCWILAIASTISTAASADFCLGGPEPGSPDTTIHNMLIAHGDYPNSTKYQFLTAYTSGCEGMDPTELLVRLERESQNQVDNIWQYIAEIDQVGRSVLSEECGGSGLDELLSAARNIAKLLTQVRRALDSMSDGLTCERIHPLYERTVHDSICTDLSEAAAWSTIIFSFLGIALMILITLRASWRIRVDDDRIYHHESEVAENMIVNEHEEYLRYISKYKHEWQEYSGFGGTAMRRSASASFSGSEGDPDEDNFYSSGSGSQTTDYTEHHNAMDMAEDLTSVESGDISFPSLQMPPSDDSSFQKGALDPTPPSILTDLALSRGEEPFNSQEALLLKESTPPSLQLDRAVPSSEEAGQFEPQGAEEVEKQPSSDSDVSTDFSSIGRNARRGNDTSTVDISPTLFWRHQIGLGIEVAISQNEDSLALSPNSESGLDSLALTKTPSPRKNKAIFDEHLENHKVPIPRNAFPDGLYAKDSSDESDTADGINPFGLARMRTEPYALKPRNSHLSVATAAVATTDAKEDRRASLMSPGSVQFQDDESEESPTYVKKQVTHFSKTGPRTGRRKPVTPNRSKSGLSSFINQFDARSDEIQYSPQNID